jgi:hypothetical protein
VDLVDLVIPETVRRGARIATIARHGVAAVGDQIEVVSQQGLEP